MLGKCYEQTKRCFWEALEEFSASVDNMNDAMAFCYREDLDNTFKPSTLCHSSYVEQEDLATKI